MEINKNIIKKIVQSFINITFWCCMFFVLLLVIQIFFFSSFKIPSNSMEPGLITGDYVLVNKLIPGARLFNIFSSINGEQVQIFRLPGIHKIKRNDVIVFNFPHPSRWDKIEMDIMTYYIKRCIGLPGDSIYIKNGIYNIDGISESLGNRNGQKKLSVQNNKQLIENNLYWSFPEDSLLGWSIKNFGPLYIPKKGDTISMDRKNAIIYRKLIEWEQQKTLSTNESNKALLDNIEVKEYIFQKNYYFVAGDRVIDSQDSRYWGLLPEEYIVGKSFMIWKSKDILTDKIRWSRIFRNVN